MAEEDGGDSSENTSVDRAIVRRFWNQQAQHATDPRAVTLDRAPRFLASFGVSLYQGWFRRVRSQFQGHVTQSVDLGCGNGQWTELLATLSDRVAASDLSPAFADACRQRCESRGLGPRVTVECADASTAHLPRHVDLVVLGAVVQYMGDAEIVELLARLRKALVPKGILYLRTTIGKRSVQTKLTESFQGIYRPASWYDRRLETAGFHVLRRATATTLLAEEIAARSTRLLFHPARTLLRLTRAHKTTDIIAYFCRPAS